MTISIPELSLVVLVGVSGSGKSSFAARHFLPTEVLSSDFCRGLVSDDENDQAATPAAFDVLHYVAGKRLEAGRLTVVDATNVQPEARKPLVALAKKHHVLAVAIVLDVPEAVCTQRNAARPDRSFGAHVLVCGRAKRHRTFRKIFSQHGEPSRFRKAEPANVCASARWRCGPSPFSGSVRDACPGIGR